MAQSADTIAMGAKAQQIYVIFSADSGERKGDCRYL